MRRSRRAVPTRSERGAVLVELVLVVPVLLLLAMGTAEFGLAWRERLAVQSATRAAARAGAGLGAVPTADYDILQSLRSGLGGSSGIRRVVIYRATAADGSVPVACRTGTGSQSGLCNVYDAAAMNAPESEFGCGIGDRDNAWCPTSRDDDVFGGLDDLGVYIELDHGYVTGMFGTGPLVIRDRVVMRLEPQ